jgi:WXG100 family type VII secretion target
VAGYRVDPDELRRGDAGVGQSAEHARAVVDRLRADADGLFATGWHGPAATAFRRGWEQWLAGAHDMLATLDATAALLGAAGTGYAETDDGIRTVIAGAVS